MAWNHSIICCILILYWHTEKHIIISIDRNTWNRDTVSIFVALGKNSDYHETEQINSSETQSVRAVKYNCCISNQWQDSFNEFPEYDIKPSNGESSAQ